jgi:hypothetical protein
LAADKTLEVGTLKEGGQEAVTALDQAAFDLNASTRKTVGTFRV